MTAWPEAVERAYTEQERHRMTNVPDGRTVCTMGDWEYPNTLMEAVGQFQRHVIAVITEAAVAEAVSEALQNAAYEQDEQL